MTNINVTFLIEQDGDIEREFKRRVTAILQRLNIPARAYLARVRYGDEQDNHVALCIRTDVPNTNEISLACMDIFKSMFSNKDHIDIAFLTHEYEEKIRQVCCPFYTSPNYNVTTPDFYLFSTEGYNLDDMPRACFKRQRLYSNNRRDGFMLCDITPPLIGQNYGLGDKDIHQLIFANRLQNESLFPVSNWPICIYVARVLNARVQTTPFVDESDIEPIGLAELYREQADIR